MTARDWFDLAVLLLLFVGMGWGFLRGFLSSFAFLLATLIGIWGARHFQEGALEFCGLEPSGIARGAAFFVLFALISMIVHQFMNILERMVEKRRLMAWNRVLGLLYGTGFSMVVCWIAAWFLTEFPQTRLAVTHSRSARYLVVLAEFSQEAWEAREARKASSASPDGSGSGAEEKKDGRKGFFSGFEKKKDEPKSATIPETFIERVQEDAAIPKQEAPPQADGKSSAIPEILDRLDERMSGVLPKEGSR